MLRCLLQTACAGVSKAACLCAEVSNQVESFWQELFDGTSYSSGFISSLSNLTDLQEKLQIPEAGV